MLKENKNYVFIINNVFHIIYYISLINKFNIKKYLLIINNTNNFFYLGKYNKVFNENNIKYFVCCGENYNFKNFLYKIPFNYIYCYINLYKYRKYNLIISDDNNISNQIIINSVGIRNKELILINNNLYGLIYKKYKFENKFKVNKIYNLFLKFCKINKRREIGKNYLYNKKYYIDAIDLSLIKDSKEYLENIFKSYIKGLDKIINNNNNIILFSQNLIDEGRINKSDYLRNLEKIQRKFQGYNLYIKPHPLENTTYYENEYKVINKFIPSELLDIYLSMFGKNIYLTYYSTIILNIQNGDKFLIDFNNLPNEEKLIIKELNTNFNIDILKINE